ncbi:sarcolemmal membrane-associated protein [Striga asiatica]|uniref:Sarcolemmal membrane-associated protein n=1 Tax=Striga asiatica TaxID=4170 RepID=A0A5A7RHM0_STRAF|nr:sarcolemmal membrane-associated protein [Striga asiatica]
MKSTSDTNPRSLCTSSTCLLNSSRLVEGSRLSPPLHVIDTESLKVSDFLSSFHFGVEVTNSSESNLCTFGCTFQVSLFFSSFFFVPCFPPSVIDRQVASIVLSSSEKLISSTGLSSVESLVEAVVKMFELDSGTDGGGGDSEFCESFVVVI